jgi:hypothetical protein
MGGAPVVVSSESTMPAPDSKSGGTSVFVLPGKKQSAIPR